MNKIIIFIILVMFSSGCSKEKPVPPVPPPATKGVDRLFFDSSLWNVKYEIQGLNTQVIKSFETIFKFVLKDSDGEKIFTNWQADVFVCPVTERRNYDVFGCTGVLRTCSDTPMGRVNGKVARSGGLMKPMMLALTANNGVLSVSIKSTRVKPDGSLLPNYDKYCDQGCNSIEPIAIVLRVPKGKDSFLYKGVYYSTPNFLNVNDPPYYGVVWEEISDEESRGEWLVLRARWLLDPEIPPPKKFQMLEGELDPPAPIATCPCSGFVDDDDDGTDNCFDECPDDPTKMVTGINGCGIPEGVTFCAQFDYDNDGDIDQDDFGILQMKTEKDLVGFKCCDSGPNIPFGLYCIEENQ